MIYEKQLSAPAFRRRKVRRELSLFGGSGLCAQASHFREDGGLVCAEGGEFIEKFPSGRLYVCEGHSPVRFVFRSGALLSEGEENFFIGTEPEALFCYLSQEGKKKYYALLKSGLYELASSSPVPVGAGGSCGAVHRERLFTADGVRVHWSAPLAPSEHEEKLQGAGHLDLPSARGDILAMFSFRGKLALIRERGVSLLSAGGSTLDFMAEEIPFSCGRVQKGTACVCGEEILFLTGDGLYAFDGTRCVRRQDSGFSALDCEAAAAASYGGNYYALVRFRGERCIWCVDAAGRGHVIARRAEQLAGGEKLYFAEEGELFSLTPRGLPAYGRQECTLVTERSLLGLSCGNKFLDAVTVEGEGRFRAEARGEYGLPRAASGRAGERIVFPLPVRGNTFTLSLRTLEERARIRAVVFDLREEVPKW